MKGDIPKVGDRVKLTITGEGSGTSLAGVITIRPGASMKVSGKIVEDLGDSWLVELSISVGEKNRLVVPKPEPSRARHRNYPECIQSQRH